MTKPKECIIIGEIPKKKSPYIWIVWFPILGPMTHHPGNMSMSSKFGELPPPPQKKKSPKLSGSFQWVLGVAHNVSREKKGPDTDSMKY